jgi:hypothetical protein
MRLADLDAALRLMTRLSELFQRFDRKSRSALLTIVTEKIVVDVDDEIVDYELKSPFAYLHTLARDLQKVDEESCGSDHIRLDTGLGGLCYFAGKGSFLQADSLWAELGGEG